MANRVDIHNFKLVKSGNADQERNYTNDILHALVSETDDLQTQIDNLAGGGGDTTQGSVLTAVQDTTLPNSRVLIGQDGVVSTEDDGPGTQFIVGIVDGGIDTTQLADGGVTAVKLAVTGSPSATTVIQDDGTTLTYVEKLSSVVGGTNITIDNTDPINPIINATGSAGGISTINTIPPDISNDFQITSTDLSVTITPTTSGIDLSAASGGGVVASVVAGTSISVDSTDPANPIVSVTATGVTATSYGDSTHWPVYTVNAEGQLTASSVQAAPTSLPPSGTAGGDLTGTYPNPTIGANKVTNAKLAQMADQTIKGNNAGSTGNPIDLTIPQVVAMLPDFTGGGSGARGLVPDPGSLSGPSTYTLRADGIWRPTSSGGVVSVNSGTGITVDNTIPSAPIINITDTAVTPGTYGDSTHYTIFTVNQQGQLTAASQAALPTVPVGANPTASVGLSAVNGSAATFLRSDGAPALSQSISPTWSGNHTFSNLITASAGLEATGGSIACDTGNVTAGSLGHVRAVGGLSTLSGTPTIYVGLTGNTDPPTVGRLFVDDSSGKTDVLQMTLTGGATTAPVAFNFSNAFALSGTITPSALSSGNNNNYNPTGLATATVLRLQPNAASSTITGITAQPAGTILTLVNAAGLSTITLSNADTNSTAANRFSFSASVTLSLHDAITIWYDGTASRWVRIDPASSSSGQGNIQIQDDAVNQGTAGQATTWNFAGGLSASVSSSTATLATTGLAFNADIQVFSTPGSTTWTKPSGAKRVKIYIVGGGGGGGGGVAISPATARSGGAGGGGGCYLEVETDAANLGSTETVVVAAGGTAGAAGSPGNVGGDSSFGSLLKAYGGGAGLQGSNSSSRGGGGGGAASAGTNGTTGAGGSMGGAIGQVGAVTDNATPIGGAGGSGSSQSTGVATTGGRALGGGQGGGGGGGVLATPTAFVGAVGQVFGWQSTVAGGTIPGGPGGTATGINPYLRGAGGGGGASSVTNGTAGGAGGNGQQPGGGGGGGGSYTNASAGTAGAGGNGGDGIVVVVCYF